MQLRYRDSRSLVDFCSDIQQPLSKSNGRWLRLVERWNGQVIPKWHSPKD
jgi:hypothetical protein